MDILHLVSKSTVTNPYLITLFQPDFTFVKECRFYAEIIPAIEYFENDSNITEQERLDIFIRCFGYRISLKSGKSQCEKSKWKYFKTQLFLFMLYPICT